MKDSKENILKTSLVLFMQKGFKNVTMQQIVSETHLSKGAFYHYFGSKEQVFAEVIEHLFTGMMVVDHAKFPQQSLKAFYTGILDWYDKNTLELQKKLPVEKENAISSNYYYLLFDALKMLPEFKRLHEEQQQTELKTWTHMMGAAKKNHEIRSGMSDEQLAKIFIYLGDGLHINHITGNHVNRGGNELKQLWDSLYATIKI